MTPKNLLVLMSDEHNPKVLGCAGHPLIAHAEPRRARGARHALHIRLHHLPDLRSGARRLRHRQVRPPDRLLGQRRRLRRRGAELAPPAARARPPVVSIGKLHFRGAPGDDHGFTEEIMPMHVVEGDRRREGPRARRHPEAQGRRQDGEDSPAPASRPIRVYDRDIASRAQIWLHEERQAPARRRERHPGCCSCRSSRRTFRSPRRPSGSTGMSPGSAAAQAVRARTSGRSIRISMTTTRVVDYDTHFTSPTQTCAARSRATSGSSASLDENVGKVLGALRGRGLADDTRVIYTSDHGDNIGARGLWGKSTIHEESAGVPLIVAGRRPARGRRPRRAGQSRRRVSVRVRLRRRADASRRFAAGRVPHCAR